MDNTTKELIKVELDNFVTTIGSQNKASKILNVSNATVSKIQAGKFYGIGSGIWLKISKNLGMRLSEAWHHADTKPALKLTGFFDDAREHGNVFGLVCIPGGGKTDLLDHYRKQHPNVFYVKCERHITERELLDKLLQTMGRKSKPASVTKLIELVKAYVNEIPNPVIIIDEMEKVKNAVMCIFIDLYNALWKRCGIILIGTPNLKDRIIQGNERGILGYNEILSRLGGKVIEIPSPDVDDAVTVIKANGITDPMTIASIANGSTIIPDDSKRKVKPTDVVDLRRTERLIHAAKQKEAEMETEDQEAAA